MNLRIILRFITFLFLTGIVAEQAAAQCTAPIAVSPDSGICGNRTFNFSVGQVTATTFDFASTFIPVGWSSSPYVIGQPCWTYMVDSSTYFWATLRTGGVRFVQTQPLNVSAGGTLRFYMRYGADDPDPGCEDPDLVAEGVYLQYSLNGTTWVDITNWVPNPTKSGPLYVWTQYNIPIPPGAASANTRFRWYQPQNSGDQFDNWGLDDIFIQANIGGILSHSWNFGDSTTSTLAAPTKTYAGSGNYNVTLTVTVSGGCTSTVNRVVRVIPDTIPPTAVTRNIIRSVGSSGTITITPADIDNGSFDNCAITSRSVSPNTFSCSQIGNHAVTLTLSDTFNNIRTATAFVTIVDSVPPVIRNRANLVYYLDNTGNRNLIVSQIDSNTTDNCGLQSITVIPNRVGCSDVGNKTITLVAQDIYNNTSTKNITVTVLDTVRPRARAQDRDVYLNASGWVKITGAFLDNGSSDNCSFTLTATPDSFTCANIGPNIVTLRAQDSSGNFTTATCIVTVFDTVTPIPRTKNITVYLDEFGSYNLQPTEVDSSSSDNCAITTRTVMPDFFTCSDIGANTVTLTLADASANSSNKTATVTVLDTIAPFLFVQDLTVYLDTTNRASITPFEVDMGSYDNCSLDSIWVLPDTFTCANVGNNVVTFFARDVFNNIRSTTLNVTVIDSFPPQVAAKQNVLLYLDSSGTFVFNALLMDSASTDNCGIDSFTVEPPVLTCANLGLQAAVLAAIDLSGTIAYDTFTYTLIDTLRPRVVPRDITAYLNTSGYTKITAIVADSASFDNCSIADRTLSMDSFTCAQLGDNVVWLRVTDNSGNIDSASFTVHIIDTVAPVVITQNINAFLDTAGNAQISPVQANLGSSDNCAIDSMWVVPNSFDCSKRGLASAMLFVRDVSGNTGSAAFGVSVIDTLKPLPLARNLTIYLDTAGVASITATDADSASSDNCAIASRTLSQQLFDCAHLGDNLVYLTIADSSSNHDSVQFTVTVLDTISPVLHLRSIIAYLDATGNVTITAQQLDSASVDNCAISQRSVTPSIFNCTHLGVNTVQFSASDTSGNTTIAFVDISVIDTVRPVVNTQPATIYVDAAGNAAVIAADVNNGSADNCGIDSIWVLPDVITCANLGSNIVTLFVRDSSGNTGSASANVTVLDTIRPNTITQNITVYVNATGNVSIIPAQINNGSTDNCAIDSMVVVPNTFNCSNLGANTVTLTSFDSSGNNSSANATVTVLDTISPVTITKNITVYLDATGNSSIIPADVDNGTLDNCAIDSMSVVPNTLDCSNLGANIVTLTTYDSSGNYSSATATVTVLDTVRPLVFTKNISVYVDASGNAVITASDVNNSSNDNCGIDSMWVIPSVFNCATSGNNQVELFVRDSSGNIASAFANLNVIDTIVPIVLTKTDTVYLNNIGIGSTTASRVNNNSTDNCYIKQMWVVPSSFNCNSIGANTVELFVEDSSGNIASAFAMVIVLDTVAPVISTQPVTVYLDATGVANLTAADVNNGTTDQCKLDTLYLSKNLFNCFDLGANTIQFYAVDSSGNESRSDVQITVADTIRPSIIKRNITVYIDSTGTFKIDPLMVDSASFDNCAIVNRTVSPDTLKCANLGFNTITLTVFDQSGNFISDTLTIELRDTLTPVARAKDITVYLDATGNVAIQPIDIDNGSSDYCKVISIAASQLNFNCTHLGPNIDTLYVTDNGMNTQIALSTVTVVDTISPNNLTKSLHTLYVDANGLVSLLPTDIDSASTDNCTLDSIWVIPNSFDCTNLGTNQVTFYSRDQSGNISQSLTLVEVLDTIRPNTVAQNITVYIDAGGNVNITPTQVNNGSADNCAIDSMSVVPNTFNCSNLGANTVTLTTFDSSGNFSSATATVTVLDTIRPNTIAQNITVYLDATGNVSITPVQVNNGSTDNCAIDSMMVVPNTFDCSNLGANTVTLTTFDSSGNFSSAIATVTVLDTIRPNTITQNITVYVDATGNVSITPAQVNNGSNDNCAIDTMTVTPNVFDCSNLGANTVTLATFDSSGNFSSANATVTVRDTIHPVAIANGVTVYVDSTGTLTISPSLVNAGSSDNCGIKTLTVVPSIFSCTTLGGNLVTLFVEDFDGNISSDTCIVIVNDTLAPVARAKDTTIYLDANGFVAVTPQTVDNGTLDYCNIQSVSVSPVSFDCSNKGPNTVTYTVTDIWNNTTIVSSTVTVADSTRPVLRAYVITLYLDTNGLATLSVNDVDSGSTDNCGINSRSISQTLFDCSNLGQNIITFTADDTSGNIAQIPVSVTVIDTVRPRVYANNITVYLDTLGVVSITPALLDSASADNCVIANRAISKSTFDCSNKGDNTVELTVTDSSGNVQSVFTNVHVLDTIAPVAVLKNITVYLNADGYSTYTASLLDSASTDNCGIASRTVTPDTLYCAQLGLNTVQVSLADSSGNTIIIDAAVTVIDTIRPTPLVRNIDVYLNAAGYTTITPVMIDSASFDNCSISNLQLDVDSFTCANVGLNTVLLTLKDQSGNVNSKTATVRVIDTIAPVVYASHPVLYLDQNGLVALTAVVADSASTDACGIQQRVVTPSIFNCSQLGITNYTLTVTDVNGNVSSNSATVFILDTIKPQPHTRNINAYLNSDGYVVLNGTDIDSASTDNCSIVSRVISQNTFTCAHLGPNAVTLTLTDQSGNVNQSGAVVTVIDTVKPLPVGKDITVYLNNAGTVTISGADIDSTSTDNCSIVSRIATPSLFGCSNTGFNQVVLSVTDQSGNTGYDTLTVQVLDTIVPVVNTRNITAYLNTSGFVGIAPSQIDSASADACGIDSMWVIPTAYNCSNIGVNTITLFVRDNKGNVSSAAANVSVVDTVAPLIYTKSATLYLDASGKALLTTADVDSASTDNCYIYSKQISKDTFDCSNLGSNIITYHVADSSGNTAQLPVSVTVLDTIRPIAQLKNITAYLDPSGVARFAGIDFDSASFDNCSVNSFTVVPDSFTCAQVGINQVLVSVIDQSGNTQTVPAFVNVLDTIKPDVRIRNILVYLDATGNATITATQVDSSSADNCGIATRTVQPASFTCADVGNNTVVLTVTDVNGNVDSAAGNVLVIDTIRPIASAKPVQRVLNAAGYVTITGTELDSVSSDACGIASYTALPDSFTCANTGNNQIVLKVVDVNGNVSYDTTTIQILDTILPVPAPRVLTAYLQANGRVSITGAQLDSASFDRCGIAAFNVQPDTFSCANLGSNTVTFTVTDVNGNVNSTPAIVIIEDTIAPVPVLHNITVYLNASGSSTISAAMIDSASFDNCTLSSVTLNRTVFGCGEKGAQTVVATLTDQSNNISTAQAVVTVLDTIKPVVRPKQVFAAYLDTLGLVNVVAQSLDSASSDNCGIAQFALSRSTFSCVDLGMNRVVLSVSDSSGNIDTASAWIRVIDTIAPRPSLITVTAYLDTAGRVIVTGSQFNQASVDNCTIDSIAINRSLFTCSDIGTNRVFVTLIDNSGNRASDSATILILDTIRPKPICPAAVTLFAHADTCGRTFVLPTPPVLNIDNCSAVFSSNAPINNYYPVGTTTVLWTATDPSGNTGSCPQNVIVRDTVRPVVRTRNIIAYLNASGNITIAPQMIDSASSDACGIDSIHLDRRTFNCSNIGANVVRLFVTDVNGNVNSATATVNVVDTVRPTLLGRNVVVYLNAAGTITIPPSLLDNGSTDACGSVKLSISDSVFTCTNVGNNTVNLTVTDLYGNFITQPFNVQVRDTVRPVARAKDLVLTLTLPTNLQTITVADVDNGSADACGIDTMWLSKYSFNISNLGNNIVTLTVRDKNGNISSTNFNVFVKENNPPIARCKSIEMTLANGKVVITPQMIDNGSTDETGIVSYTIDRDSFTCADIGNNTVRLTVTDVHGLSASCDATVRIKGVIPKFTPFVEIDKNGPVIGIPDILPDPNQMYIGYGPQTMKLGIKTSDERPFDYVWEGPGILNPTDSAPTFIPLEAGVYNLRATVTNMYGCVNSFTVDACVLDVRDPRPNFNVGEKQVVVCMKPLKNMRDSFSLSVPISEVPAKIAMGARIGHCDMRCGGETMVELVSDNLTYDAVVYPNPTNYTINLKIVTTQIKAQFDFTVFNINGKVVYEQQNQDPFNVISFGEDFEAGLYIVEVKYKEGTRTFSRRYKVIKVN
jgi:hypothetical protein